LGLSGNTNALLFELHYQLFLLRVESDELVKVLGRSIEIEIEARDVLTSSSARSGQRTI
jgi:hypothetical protein